MRNESSLGGATLADYQHAARQGFISGGVNPASAAAIVDAASENVAPIIRHEMTPDLLKKFLASCRIEAMIYALRYGERTFARLH
jgi:hypothetical protein